MSKEVVAEVIALIELGLIAPEDIVKCLRKANSEPEKALAEQPAQIAGFDVVLDESMPPNTMKFVQPAQQEPVAAECNFVGTKEWGRCSIEHHNLVQSEPHKWPGYQTRLLYTSPPAQRKPLTVDQVWENNQLMSLNAELGCSMDLLVEVVQAIEAAHGIKENT